MSSQRFTPEFKEEAVRQIVDRGYSVTEVSSHLGVSAHSLYKWVKAVKPARDEDGRLRLQRAYDFEYSDTGNNRLKGSLVLRGRRLVVINVGMRIAPAVRTLH